MSGVHPKKLTEHEVQIIQNKIIISVQHLHASLMVENPVFRYLRLNSQLQQCLHDNNMDLYGLRRFLDSSRAGLLSRYWEVLKLCYAAIRFVEGRGSNWCQGLFLPFEVFGCV